MGNSINERIILFVDKNYIWLNPLLIFTTTASSAFLTFTLSSDFTKKHPIRYALLQYIFDWIVPLFILSLFLLGLVTLYHSLSEKTIKILSFKLKRCDERLSFIHENIKNLFDGYLYHLAYNKLDFHVNGGSQRITLYIHDEGKSFIPFSRISSNPKFSQSGRIKYPDHLGCIAKGWQDGWYFDNDFLGDWKDIQFQRYSIAKTVLNHIKMKSRLFAVMRIDINGKNLGLIVVESTESNKYTESIIKKHMEEQKFYLSDMLDKLKRYIPNTNEASQRGL